jgi:hypothetical protein
LRQSDASLAAGREGVDAVKFIESIYRHNVVGLASLPTTLVFLLNEFKESGSFSGTHRELYERGCRRLARENDPQRVEAMRSLRQINRISTPDEIFEAASLLAALVLICGKSAIYVGPITGTDTNADLHLSEAADENLTEDLLYDAIGSGLFTSRGHGRAAK